MAVADKRLTFSDCAFWVFAVSIALAPVGFGGNRPLPFGLVQTGLALSCIFLLFDRTAMAAPRFFARIGWAFALFGLVILWAWYQTMPFVPASWINPLWSDAATTLGRPLRGAISISPEDSRVGLIRLITYVAAGALAYFHCQRSARAQRLVQALWAAGSVICAYGLITYLLGINKILWFEKTAYEGDLTAVFVNRNHFAIYAGMIMLCGLALSVQSWRSAVEKNGNVAPKMEFLQNWLAWKGLPQVVLLALILVCIIFSHSRAGLMLTVAGFGAFIFFYLIYRKAWRLAAAALFFAFVGLTLIFVIAPYYSDRFAELFTDYSSRDRMSVYNLVLQAIRDNPWLGYGIDGFQPVFRLYQHGMVMEFLRAHSDFLESLLDLGIPVALMLWLAVALLLSGLVHGILNRRRHGSFAALALAASVMALGHALVDFDLQIPGVTLTWAVLLGAGLAQSWRASEKKGIVEPAAPKRNLAKSYKKYYE